jgi:hypothetical protein
MLHMVANLHDLPWPRVLLLVHEFRDTLVALDVALAN